MGGAGQPAEGRHPVTVPAPRVDEGFGQEAPLRGVLRLQVHPDILRDVQEVTALVVDGILDCNKRSLRSNRLVTSQSVRWNCGKIVVSIIIEQKKLSMTIIKLDTR